MILKYFMTRKLFNHTNMYPRWINIIIYTMTLQQTMSPTTNEKLLQVLPSTKPAKLTNRIVYVNIWTLLLFICEPILCQQFNFCFNNGDSPLTSKTRQGTGKRGYMHDMSLLKMEKVGYCTGTFVHTMKLCIEVRMIDIQDKFSKGQYVSIDTDALIESNAKIPIL